MKNYPESLTYLVDKYMETLDIVDMLKESLSEKIRLLDELQKRIEVWKPKK